MEKHFSFRKVHIAFTASVRKSQVDFSSSPGGSFILEVDSHNSVNGIREFARRGGAKVVYIPANSKTGHEGAFNLKEAKVNVGLVYAVIG